MSQIQVLSLCVAQLMALQSRFGTDERFRMDSRFLEAEEEKDEESGEGVGVDASGLYFENRAGLIIFTNVCILDEYLIFKQSITGELERKEGTMEDDEALEQERKKNLDILQSVLGTSRYPCSKTSSKAKTFRSDTRAQLDHDNNT